MKKIKKCMVILIVLILLAIPIVVLGSAKETNYKNVIIGFKEKPNEADERLIRECGGITKHTYHIINAKAVRLPEHAIEHIKKNPRVKYVEPDYEVHILQETLPWGVDRIDADIVWGYDNKGIGVNVCVIDTGIDYTHPDLNDNYKGGYDFVNDDADPLDDNGHGTHCAGIAAAENNSIGVVGVAPNASLYAVKVLDRLGSGWLSDCIAGIEWAVDNNMDVVSMSWGSSVYSAALEDACNAAYSAGLVLVAAAGNDGDGDATTNEYSYPAAYDSVIAVGATDSSDAIASFSNSGPYLELAAPGVNIYSTLPTYRVTLTRTYGYDYGTLSGTSMACPHVSGVAALVIASDPTLTNEEVRYRLNSTADDLGAVGWDAAYGYGLVDADGAAGIDVVGPAISNLNPADGSFINDVTPTISALLTDASGIDDASIVMTLDDVRVDHIYDNATGLVYYNVPDAESLTEGLHNATLDVNDTLGNHANASWSFTVDITPPSTVNLNATTETYPDINLTWTAATDNFGVDYYNIYRNTSETINKATDLLATVSGTATSYTDSSGTAETTYYYAVCAVDLAGNEAELSNIANATVAPAANVMHVASIDMWYTKIGRNYRIYTEVTVVDSSNNAVEDATVYLEMSLPDGNTVSGSGNTDIDGTVTFVYGPTRLTGTYISTVTNVEKIDWIYDPEANVETSEELTVP
jgi:subtilisin/minor extracellular protease Epr